MELRDNYAVGVDGSVTNNNPLQRTGIVRASPRVCQNLLGKSCVLPTSKKLCKVKKEFISNSLA
jgi:hypothetical protein